MSTRTDTTQGHASTCAVIAGWLVVVLVSGCASYPDRTEEALRAFEDGDFERAGALYGDPETTGSKFLSGAEAGTIALAAGDWQTSIEQLGGASDLSEEIEETLYEKEDAAGGLGHFLSASVYELQGCPDDAYIDRKRMEAKGVGGRLVGRSLLWLATSLRRDDELPDWEASCGADTERPEGAAEVVVLVGIGLGPYKEAITIPVSTGDGIFQWSVPRFRSREVSTSALESVAEGSGHAVSTVVIKDFSTVAKENLEDRIAWQTLPDSFQAARVFLESGTHALMLRAVGGESLALGTGRADPVRNALHLCSRSRVQAVRSSHRRKLHHTRPC